MNALTHIFRQGASARRRAFTLVELLVVIGIIAILIAILLPTLSRAKSQANSVACLANLRSSGQAIEIYVGQNKGVLPYGYWDGRGVPDGLNQGSSNLSADWALLLMSSALGKGGNTYGAQEGSDKTKIQNAFACPSASLESSSPIGSIDRKLHYSSHPRLMPNLDDYDMSKSPPRPLLKPWKIAKVRRSAEIVLIFDGAQIFNSNNGNAFAVGNGLDQDGLYRGDTTQGRSWNYLFTKPGLDTSIAVFTPNKDAQVGGAGVASIRWRHGNDLANFVFADYHAESRRLKFGANAEIKLRNVYLDP
jgi:prepilin-type N-terminal cleavage/methylation domain-containing protein